jgi:hypothetical protein
LPARDIARRLRDPTRCQCYETFYFFITDVADEWV